MMNRSVTRAREALGRVKNRLVPAAVELKLRRQVAFDRLHPEVDAVKSSPIVQIAFAAAITGLVLTGRWRMAAGVATVWLASRPITHVVAGGAGAVGMIDDLVRDGNGRLHEDLIRPAIKRFVPAEGGKVT
jgi:hypothetical protein